MVCMGPLTNIAMTMKLYPEFADNVKEFFVMGGNSTGMKLFVLIEFVRSFAINSIGQPLSNTNQIQ